MKFRILYKKQTHPGNPDKNQTHTSKQVEEDEGDEGDEEDEEGEEVEDVDKNKDKDQLIKSIC